MFAQIHRKNNNDTKLAIILVLWCLHCWILSPKFSVQLVIFSNPLATNVFHHIETSQLICIANFGFYKKLETAKQIIGKKLKPETPQQT